MIDADFLFGGGFALLVALLGWSDQIRGLQERTRAQEQALMNACYSSWGTLEKILRPDLKSPPDAQLRAVLRMIGEGTIKTGDDVQLIEQFQSLNQQRALIERIYRARYGFLFVVIFFMFLFGIYQSIGLLPKELPGGLRSDLAYSVVVLVLISVLVVLTAILGGLEDDFREKLNAVEDHLRSTKPQTQSRRR